MITSYFHNNIMNLRLTIIDANNRIKQNLPIEYYVQMLEDACIDKQYDIIKLLLKKIFFTFENKHFNVDKKSVIIFSDNFFRVSYRNPYCLVSGPVMI
jgi:hypothetical protein